MEKALAEDATVYQYDEVYDQMEEKKKENEQHKLSGGNSNVSGEKKSKYINKLMKSAEMRKIENERRKERKVLKERESEGGEFDDKEEFVTSAYLFHQDVLFLKVNLIWQFEVAIFINITPGHTTEELLLTTWKKI